MRFLDPARRRLLGLALAAVVVSAGVAGLEAGTEGDPADPEAAGLSPAERVEALVARASYEQGRIRTLEARFTQRKESELLLEPELSSGTLSFQAPDRLRWEFAAPTSITLLIRDRRMITWYRALDRVEDVELGRHGERFTKLLGPGASLAELRRYFSLAVAFPAAQDRPYRIDLEPLSRRIERRVQKMTIHLDRELFVPIYLSYVEAPGEVTELELEDLQINGKIPEDRFELELPEGVEWTRLGD